METTWKQIIRIAIGLFFGISTAFAQPVKKKKTHYEIWVEGMLAAFSHTINNAVEKKTKTDCKVAELMGKDAIPTEKELGYFRNTLMVFQTPSSIVDDKIAPHFFKRNMDAAVHAIGVKKTLTQFTEHLTKQPIGDLTKEERSEFKRYYTRLKDMLNWWDSGQKKTVTKGPCTMEAKYYKRITKYAYPRVYWEIKVVVTINCDCKKPQAPTRFKNAVYEYTANTQGIITSDKYGFGVAKDPKLRLVRHTCCPDTEEEKKEKDHGMYSPSDQEEDSYYVSLNGGIGFHNDFNETGFCLTADYVHHVTDVGNSDLYVGGGGGYETMSGDGFSMSGFMVGPTAELFTPINDSGDLLWINGLSGYYSFGNRDFGGFESTYTGLDAVFRSGLNLRISSNVLVGIEIPILTWKQRTFKDEFFVEIMDPYGEGQTTETNSVKQNDFSFLLDNGNPIKLGVRFTF